MMLQLETNSMFKKWSLAAKMTNVLCYKSVVASVAQIILESEYTDLIMVMIRVMGKSDRKVNAVSFSK